MKHLHQIILLLLCSYSITFGQIRMGVSIYTAQAEVELNIINPIYEIEAEYSSNNKESGLLGLGWSTEFEKKIIPVGDGTYLLQSSCDCPGRQENYSLVPENWDAKALKPMVKKMRSLLSAKYSEEELLSNFELRFDLLQDLIAKGRWDIPKVEEGQMFYAFETSSVSLKILQDAYQYQDGKKKYYFDKKSKLYQIEMGDKAFKLEYNNKNQLTKLSHQNGDFLEFNYNNNGAILKISNPTAVYFSAKYEGNKLVSYNDKIASYVLNYYPNNLLAEVLEEATSIIRYQYDKELKVISKWMERDSISYNYKKTADQKLEVQKTVYTESWDGLDSVNNSVKIEFGINSLGKEYLKSQTYSSRGIATTNRYAEGGSCQLLELENRGSTTHFTYNQRGRLTGKYNDKGAMIRILLDPKTQKIAQTYNSDDRAYWYLYDEKENLVYAEDNYGHKIEFVYNANGKIIYLLDYKKNRTQANILHFKYNEIGKPIFIGLEGIGSINVNYDEYGEISRVNSASGHKMALQVTQAFQNTLTLAKPSGVNTNGLNGQTGDNTFNYESDLLAEGLRVVGENANWGYQDEAGNWKIPAEYEYAADFKDGWGIVRKNQKYAALKTDGSFWLPLGYDFIAPPYNGYVRIKKDGKWGLVNLKGEEIFPPKYDYLFDVDENGYAKVRIGEDWNLINLEGVLLFEQNLSHFNPWNDNFWLIDNNDKYGIYNAKGKEILAVKYDKILLADEHGVFLVQNGSNWNIARIDGEEIQLSENLAYQQLSISDNILEAKTEDGYLFYGLTDSLGQILIRPIYESLEEYYGNDKNGGKDALYYTIKKEDKIGFLNAKGKLILEAEYELDEKNVILFKNDQYCFYYLQDDSIYLNCFDSLSLYQESYGDPVRFIAKNRDNYALLHQDSIKKEQLKELLAFKYKAIEVVSSDLFLLKQKKYFELFSFVEQEAILKKIKSVTKQEMGYYGDESYYVLELKKGYQFLKKGPLLSPVFKSIQPIEGSYNYIVETKSGFGVFSAEYLDYFIIPDYDKIRVEDGAFYGTKNGKEELIELD